MYLNNLQSPFLKKGSPYSITERRVLQLILVLGSQPAGNVSHKPGGRLPLLSARHAVTAAALKRAATATNFALGEHRHNGVNSLPKTVTRQQRVCDLNPGLSAPESSTATKPPWSVSRRKIFLHKFLPSFFSNVLNRLTVK